MMRVRYLLNALGATAFLTAAAIGFVSNARADGATVNVSATIAVTNTFQSLQALSAQRNGCLIQNNAASNKMYVFIGPIASATLAKSVVLAAGATFNCGAPGSLVVDQLSITGTSGDTFYAGFQ